MTKQYSPAKSWIVGKGKPKGTVVNKGGSFPGKASKISPNHNPKPAWNGVIKKGK